MNFPLVANHGVKTLLANAFAFGRVPHAVIVEGESGMGKSVLTAYIAAGVLCGEYQRPCGECRSCHLVSVGSHPDLYVVEPEDGKKNIAVDQIRKLKNEVYRKSQMGGARVFVIDRADTMNASAQNALLKVLEEPPGDVVFILECLSKVSLLPTVLSRCVLLSLTAPELDEGVEHLVDKGYDRVHAKKALVTARGNIGRALLLLGKGKKKETETAAEEYLAALSRFDSYTMLKLTVPFEKDRVAAEQFVSSMRFILLDRLRAAAAEPAKTRELLELFDYTTSLAEPLSTNVNLALLFSAACEEYQKILSQYRRTL